MAAIATILSFRDFTIQDSLFDRAGESPYRNERLPLDLVVSNDCTRLGQVRILFRNRHGASLSRFGVRYILKKHCARAQSVTPTLTAKRLHPHSMRHSTAVHLLRAGVDIVTISQWLGHASVTTTNRCATIDLEMKRKAIEQAVRMPGLTYCKDRLLAFRSN
jgi:integrase